jgi:hypothetical protein
MVSGSVVCLCMGSGVLGAPASATFMGSKHCLQAVWVSLSCWNQQ